LKPQLANQNADCIPGEVLIKFKDSYLVKINKEGKEYSVGISSVDEVLRKYQIGGIDLVFNKVKVPRINYIIINEKQYMIRSLDHIFKLRFNKGNIYDIIDELKKDPSVDYAEPNYIFRAQETLPNDPIYLTGAQWHIDTIHAPQAWDLTQSDTNQIIGILDTGVDSDHPDLIENTWINSDEIADNEIDDDGNGFIDDTHGWDFINSDNNPNDDNGHGTHVAGISAAVTNNSLGVAGIAWRANIMPIKILQSSGYGNAAELAAGIIYAYNNGATIINMSLGSYAESLTVLNALIYAYSTSLLVASAGNDSYNIDFAPMFPACYSFVIGVEASGFSNELLGFSNFDADGPLFSTYDDLKNYEIRAPGMAIYSTFSGGNYHALAGSSMAAPIVSGAVSLIKSYFQTISNEGIFVRLIQSSNNQVLDLYKCLTFTPVPALNYINYTLFDTMPGCDHDGLPDAGEMIVLNLHVKNYGGFADSVWAKFRFGPYEDTTIARILDSTMYIGDISEYAMLSGNQDHFIIQIDSSVAHNRDIVFNCILAAKNGDTVVKQVILTAQNAAELLGIMDSTLVLTPDKLWLINGSFKIGTHGILIIKPGTHLIMHNKLVNNGRIDGYGTPDSLIHLEGPDGIYGGAYNFSYTYFSYIGKLGGQTKGNRKILYCIFEGGLGGWMPTDGCTFKHCRFQNTGMGNWGVDTVWCCNFDNVGTGLRFFYSYNNISHNNFSRNYGYSIIYGDNKFYDNNFITNTTIYSYFCYGGGIYYQIPPQYWGTTDTVIIDKMIFDFKEDPNSAIVLFQPILNRPSPLAHGVVWKVTLNGLNPQDTIIDPIGAEIVRFDVYFNRPMDTTYTPQLTFGVREPYTQHRVNDNSFWSADQQIWTAYYTFGLETGDGLNYIRVQGARDQSDFEIPVENNKRFSFVVQAASASSLIFTAVPGVGRVTLNWLPANTPDILGYNMYRFNYQAGGQYSDTAVVNTELITDTTYVDYLVTPDSTYFYLYKIVGTDLTESDYSKSVSAKPFNAVKGDANGDTQVNVLDITVVVSYMLLLNPQPFIYYAADVNNDGYINILDIIGIVQIINSQKLGVPKEYQQEIPESASMNLALDGITINSSGNIAGIQFELICKDVEKFQMWSEIDGFEFSYCQRADTVLCILYNFTNRTIPEGVVDLIRILRTENELKLQSILASDQFGREVPVLLDGLFCTKDVQAQIAPNPFINKTSIHLGLSFNSFVSVKIFGMDGQFEGVVLEDKYSAGEHALELNFSAIGSINLSPGIYICLIEVYSGINKKPIRIIDKIIKQG